MVPDYPEETKERLKLLDNLRVVLVNSKFPGNLGMTARAMRNTGVSDLRLVRPRAELNREAYQMATVGADVLDRALFHEHLSEAVADCGVVMGTTRRRGVLRRNIVDPDEAGAMLRTRLCGNKAALVLGSEDSGLDNDDLSLCNWIVGMHTGTGEESFNLSHSAAIMLHSFNRAIVDPVFGPRKLAPAHDLEHMFDDMGLFLREIGFLHEQDPKRMLMTARQILHRAELDSREVKIIRGVIRQCRWRIENPEAELLPRDTPQQTKREIMGRMKKEAEADEDQ